MSNKPDSYFSSTLEKGLRILSAFDKNRTTMSLSEIAKTVGINKTSTYRFVNTLVQLGYLKKNERSKLLALGTRAFSMGHTFLQSFELVQVFKVVIDEFFEKTDITIGSALLDNDTLFIIYKREALNTVSFRMPIMSKDLYCTAMGKAVLAFLTRPEALQIIKNMSLKKRTDKTLCKKRDLLADLERTKERGYSINNEEYLPGLIAIGAPLINRQTNRVIGAICFDFLTVDHSMSSVERIYAKTILQIAQDITEKIPIS